MNKKLLQQCTALVRRHAIEVIDIKCIDLTGYLHHISLPFYPGLLEKLVTEGVGFDGSEYGFRRVENSDMVLVPDLATAVVDPFRKAPTLSFYAHILLTEDRRKPFSQDGKVFARKATVPSTRTASTNRRGSTFNSFRAISRKHSTLWLLTMNFSSMGMRFPTIFSNNGWS